MKENICTIPVNEVFEKNDGCPICRMRDLIEAKYNEYGEWIEVTPATEEATGLKKHVCSVCDYEETAIPESNY